MIFIYELTKIKFTNLVLLKTIYNLQWNRLYIYIYIYYQQITNNNLITYELKELNIKVEPVRRFAHRAMVALNFLRVVIKKLKLYKI